MLVLDWCNGLLKLCTHQIHSPQHVLKRGGNSTIQQLQAYKRYDQCKQHATLYRIVGRVQKPSAQLFFNLELFPSCKIGFWTTIFQRAVAEREVV
jgi:hypothetical protein